MLLQLDVAGDAAADTLRSAPPDRGRRLRRALTVVDAAALFLATALALLIVLGDEALTPAVAATGLVKAVALALLGMAVMHALKLNRARVSAVRSVELRRLLVTAAAVGALAAAATADPLPTGVVVAAAVLFALGTERSVVSAWLRIARLHGRYRRPVLVVGSTSEAEHVIELIAGHPELGYDACGVVGDRGGVEGDVLGVAWLGHLDEAIGAIDVTRASGVILACNGIPSMDLNRLIRSLHSRGVHVQVWSGVFGIARHRVRVVPFAHEPMLYVEASSKGQPWDVVKRVADVALAGAGLVLAAPLLVAAALAIKLDDGGPILFRQQRVGRDGRLFTLLKLRTMAIDAEQHLADVEARNERMGPLFKLEHDPRVTRIGRFLRDASIDELPQLLNVLRGDMSMVGPRPALPSEVAAFDDELKERHRVRPGVTGLWQIEARDNPSFYAYRHLDLFYVDNSTAALDVVILGATVWAVFTRAASSVASARPSRRKLVMGGVDAAEAA